MIIKLFIYTYIYIYMYICVCVYICIFICSSIYTFYFFQKAKNKNTKKKPNNQKYYEFPKLGKHYTEVWKEERNALVPHQPGETDEEDEENHQLNGNFKSLSLRTQNDEYDDDFCKRLLMSLIDYGESNHDFNRQEDHHRHYIQKNGYNGYNNNNGDQIELNFIEDLYM